MEEQVIKQTSKEIFEFVKELVFSPIQMILKNHDLNWKQMAIYLGSVSLLTNIVSTVVSGQFRYALSSPIETTVTYMVLWSITLFVAVMVLQQKGFEIKGRELAQIWTKAALFATVISFPLTLVTFGVAMAMGLLGMIAMAVVLVQGSYQYFLQVKKLEPAKAKEAAKIIAIVIFTLPILSGLGLSSAMFLFWR